MCYTPLIAITTAVVEFILACIMIGVFRKSFFQTLFALFIVLLGTYQFTEFMLCTSQQPEFWALVGFLTYNFLPALALHGTLRFVGTKIHTLFLYVLPVLFSLFVLSPEFIREASCNEPFVTVRHLFFQIDQGVWPFVYAAYYFGFIITACVCTLVAYRQEKNKIKRRIELLELTGITLMTVPTFVLLFLFPILSIKFPSIYCHFALALAIMIFVGAYFENKLPTKKQSRT